MSPKESLNRPGIFVWIVLVLGREIGLSLSKFYEKQVTLTYNLMKKYI